MIRSSLERVSLAATRITIAIRCFQLENGRLPDSLKDLVPKYLPAVPVDPFDGSEMRYSAERKLIWSVGEDLIDAQGKDGGPDNTAEPTFALE